MAELENMTETDVPVIIDEAVKIVSKFSAEKSTDFVNGILASYAKEVRNG
jgi:transcription termination factor NusB